MKPFSSVFKYISTFSHHTVDNTKTTKQINSTQQVNTNKRSEWNEDEITTDWKRGHFGCIKWCVDE